MRDYVWLIEAKMAGRGDHWSPNWGFPGRVSDVFGSRKMARREAKRRREANRYNFPKLTIQYRAAKYRRETT